MLRLRRISRMQTTATVPQLASTHWQHACLGACDPNGPEIGGSGRCIHHIVKYMRAACVSKLYGGADGGCPFGLLCKPPPQNGTLRKRNEPHSNYRKPREIAICPCCMMGLKYFITLPPMARRRLWCKSIILPCWLREKSKDANPFSTVGRLSGLGDPTPLA